MLGVFLDTETNGLNARKHHVIEIAYKKHRGLKEKDLELAKTAADRWRGNIEVSKIALIICLISTSGLIK